MNEKIDWLSFESETEAVHFIIDAGLAETYAGARKYMFKNIPGEPDIQRKVIKRINQLIPSAFVWKAAAGPYSRKGIPDVCAIIRGRFYGFEVKRPVIGKVTPIQLRTMQQIEKSGGRCFVVTNEGQLPEILGDEIIETAADGRKL
jgi:hypothetical protein